MKQKTGHNLYTVGAPLSLMALSQPSKLLINHFWRELVLSLCWHLSAESFAGPMQTLADLALS